MNAMPHRIKVIDDFKAGLLAEIVDAGDVDQIVERQFVVAEFCDPTKITCCDRVGRLATKFSLTLNFRLECFREAVEQFFSTHAHSVMIALLFLFSFLWTYE